MENPYQHTPTDDGEEPPRKHRAGRILAITGALFQLGALVGFLALVIEIANFGVDIDRPPRPHTIGDEPFVSYAVFIGFFLGLIGLILLMIALLGTRYRARWFFWFLLLYGILLTVAMPLIPFGAVFIIYCLVRRTDFFPRVRPPDYYYRERRRER